MRDPYQISEDQPVEPRHERARRGMLRPVLWLLLIISVSANAVTSSLGHMAVSIVFGVVTLAIATTLAVHHYRTR